jgi:hypothetical protein
MPRTVGPDMANSSTDADRSNAAQVEGSNPLVEAVRLRWKHALIVFVLGTTTYALYTVGGWSIDTAVFGITTLAFMAYSAATYRTDAQ